MQLGAGLVEIFLFSAPHFSNYEKLTLMNGRVRPSKSAHCASTDEGVASAPSPHPHACVCTHTHTHCSPTASYQCRATTQEAKVDMRGRREEVIRSHLGTSRIDNLKQQMLSGAICFPSLKSLKKSCRTLYTHTHMSTSKTGKICKMGRLHQCHYLGGNTILYFCKMLP